MVWMALMAIGRRHRETQPAARASTDDPPRSPGHPFRAPADDNAVNGRDSPTLLDPQLQAGPHRPAPARTLISVPFKGTSDSNRRAAIESVKWESGRRNQRQHRFGE